MIAYQDHNNCRLFCWKKDITVLITLFLQVTVPNEWATLSTVCSLDLILEEICHRDDPVNIPGHVSVQAGVAAASEEIVTSHSTDNIQLLLTLCRCWWCPPGCTCSCGSTSRVRRSPPGNMEGLLSVSCGEITNAITVIYTIKEFYCQPGKRFDGPINMYIAGQWRDYIDYCFVCFVWISFSCRGKCFNLRRSKCIHF